MRLTCYEFRKLIEDKGNLGAAKVVHPDIQNKAQADMLIFRYVSRLLDAGNYEGAAVILWGDRLFNPRPWAVKEIWSAIKHNAKCLIMGCGSVGKSYSAVAYYYLDWQRDPAFTSIKVISTTKGHAKSNTFSTFIRLHREACIKMPGEVTSDYIGLDKRDRKSGISVIAIPTGDDGKGRLQGFHPDPRPKPHPTLGPSSRVRALIDECEEAPSGVWEGVDNMLVAQEGHETIKVTGAFNPKDQTSVTAHNAEPQEGWEAFDLERGVKGKDQWMSKNRWFVLRIDGKKTENVRLRRMKYPGFMSYEGFRELELKDGGNSVNYYTFGRGGYPPEGSIGVLISGKILSECRGEYVWFGTPIKAAGVDTAVDGRDNCVLTIGRVGKATAFQRRDGKILKFQSPRDVVQVDQQYIVKKGSIKAVGDNIISMCLKLGVSPEYVCVDATGNGAAVYSYVKSIWSEDVQGIDFNKAASKIKILEEDQFLPEERYEGVVSEVWFAVSRWMEFNYLAIAPGVRKDPLEPELLGRRYVLGAGKKLRVEKKDDYKKRMGSTSPDFADSLTIFLHAARSRSSLMGSMVEDTEKKRKPRKRAEHGIVDVPTWVSG